MKLWLILTGIPLKIFKKKEKPVVKISLDDFSDKLFEFDIKDLIYINSYQKSENIIVCIKGKEPKLLPLTGGNLQYLQTMVPYQELTLDRNLKEAQKKFLNSQHARSVPNM